LNAINLPTVKRRGTLQNIPGVQSKDTYGDLSVANRDGASQCRNLSITDSQPVQSFFEKTILILPK
jgi:hypothetical protein